MITFNTRRAMMMAVVMAAGASYAKATTYTWNIAGGGSWDSAASWDVGVGHPFTTGDTAKIYNTLPSGWPINTTQTVTVDSTDINGANLDLRDDDTGNSLVAPYGSTINLQVNQNAAFNRIDWFNDVNGNGRSFMTIAAGKTLSVNTLNMTGRFWDHVSGSSGNGIMAFTPDGGGAATYNYFGGTEQFTNFLVMDHSAVTTMTYHQNGGGAFLQARDTTWIVGNAGADQTWNITGGRLTLQMRQVGNPWQFIKVGSNNVDMGARGAASDGVDLQRGDLQGVPEAGQRNLFASNSGGEVGGTVKIANYNWTESENNSANPYFLYDKLGANLTVTAGGQVTMADRAQATENDVNVIWVGANALKVQGSGGNISITDSSATSTGRMGIHFQGGSLDAGGNISLLGPNTFLNDGGSNSTMHAGGNVTIQSRNPTGFSTIDGLTGGATAAYDDFNLLKTALTMDGGGTKTLTWDTGAPGRDKNTLTAGDFSQANFALGSMTVSGNTLIQFLGNNNLYLSGLTLTGANDGFYFAPFSTGAIYLYDPTNAQYASLLTADIQGAYVTLVPGVGEIIAAPEPATLGVLAVGALALVRRRRV